MKKFKDNSSDSVLRIRFNSLLTGQHCLGLLVSNCHVQRSNARVRERVTTETTCLFISLRWPIYEFKKWLIPWSISISDVYFVGEGGGLQWLTDCTALVKTYLIFWRSSFPLQRSVTHVFLIYFAVLKGGGNLVPPTTIGTSKVEI